MDRTAEHTSQGRWALGEAVVTELRRLLAVVEPLAASETPIEIAVLSRKHSVLRASVVEHGEARSVVLKQLDLSVAQRNRLVANRWLPTLELQAAPKLLAVVAAPDVESVWHVYEDVRGVALKEQDSDPVSVITAVELIGALHTRAAGHPLLTECRRAGIDFGMHFFNTNVGDALRLLEALRPPAVRPTLAETALCGRLRKRLEALLSDAARRARLLADAGGPETMLHGDLWTTNIVLAPGRQVERAWLIDWDHAGTGPVSYDLSTLLYRFPRGARPWVLEQYRNAVARSGWQIPPVAALNVLCETAEVARYANRIVWPALALLEDGAAWGFPELHAIDQWFEALEPVLDA